MGVPLLDIKDLELMRKKNEIKYNKIKAKY